MEAGGGGGEHGFGEPEATASPKRSRGLGCLIGAIVAVVAVPLSVVAAASAIILIAGKGPTSLSDEQAQVVGCVNALTHAGAADSIQVTMSPGADPTAPADVQSVAQDEGFRGSSIQSPADSLELAQDLLGERDDLGDLDVDTIGAMVTIPYDEAQSSDREGLIELVRQQPGVESVSYGAKLCVIDDPSDRDLIEANLPSRWKDGTDLTVFMVPDAGVRQVEEMRDLLIADPTVEGVIFFTQDDAFVEFACLFRGDPNMVNSVSAEILPTSFRVRLDEASSTSSFSAEMKERPGVRQVVVPAGIDDLAAMDSSSAGTFRAIASRVAAADCLPLGTEIK